MKNLNYLVYLHSLWLSQKQLLKIFEVEQNYKEIFEKLSFDLLKDFGLRSDKIGKVLDKKNKVNIEDIDEKLNERNVSIITIHSNEYPEEFFDLDDYPFFFYLRWNLGECDKFSVIWSRVMTNYSLKAMKEVIPDISNNFTIVSWWAIWCDSVAHRMALELGSKTIVCIWTWIDVDYPANNKKMYNSIAKNGWWIISIFPIWTNPSPFNFPIRNPLIAALCKWILLVEAKFKSWSLITIRHAKSLNRPIYSFPWEAFKINFEWNLSLIKANEAKMVTSSSDILEDYNLGASKRWKVKVPEFTDAVQGDIFNLLLLEPLNSDEIAEKSGVNIKEIALSLTLMEIEWHIKKIAWWFYEVS